MSPSSGVQECCPSWRERKEKRRKEKKGGGERSESERFYCRLFGCRLSLEVIMLIMPTLC